MLSNLMIAPYAPQALPVNYTGLALMVFGICLLIAETLVLSVGVLGAGGVIAFVLGAIMVFDSNVPGYAVNLGVIGGIALCAIVLLALVLWFAMRARRTRQISGDPQMLGACGELLETTNADGEAWALIYGERWRVHSGASLPVGSRVRVVRREGLLLWVVQK
jgi:membrane-bound serine protease (ClpP class)